MPKIMYGKFWILNFGRSWTFHEGEATDDEQNTQQNNPGFGRKEKGADGYRTEYQQNEANVFRLFMKVKTFPFTAIVTHN